MKLSIRGVHNFMGTCSCGLYFAIKYYKVTFPIIQYSLFVYKFNDDLKCCVNSMAIQSRTPIRIHIRIEQCIIK